MAADHVSPSGQDFYIYVVFRPNGTPCYVGKGSGDRWKRHRGRARQNPHYKHLLQVCGHDLPTSIIRENLSEIEAYQIEATLTQALGLEREGGLLINCGHGGRGGPSGIVRSAEFRERRSEIARAQWRRSEFRAMQTALDRPRGGNRLPRTKEFKAIVAEKMKGNTHTLGLKHSEGTRAKMSIARKGVPKSEAHKQAIGAALQGRIFSAETRQRLSVALRGRTLSAEARLAIKESLRARKDAGLPVGRKPKHAKVQKQCAWCGKTIVTLPEKQCCGVSCSNRHRGRKT